MSEAAATAESPRITPTSAHLEEPLKSKMAKICPPSLPAPVLYRTVARNEALFTDLIDQRLIGPTGLLDRSTIPPRLRELLILRTCGAARNDDEFNLHVRTEVRRLQLQCQSRVAAFAGGGTHAADSAIAARRTRCRSNASGAQDG